jgi:hypothetical protein
MKIKNFDNFVNSNKKIKDNNLKSNNSHNNLKILKVNISVKIKFFFNSLNLQNEVHNKQNKK